MAKRCHVVCGSGLKDIDTVVRSGVVMERGCEGRRVVVDIKWI